MKKNLKEFQLSEKAAEKYYKNLEADAKSKIDSKLVDAGYAKSDIESGFGELLTKVHEEKPEVFIDILGILVPTEDLDSIDEAVDPGSIAMLFTMGAAAGLPAMFKVLKKKFSDSKRAEEVGRILFKIDDKYPGGIKALKRRMEDKFTDWRDKVNAMEAIKSELEDYLKKDEIAKLRYINNFFHKDLREPAAKARGNKDTMFTIPYKKIVDTYKKNAKRFNLTPIMESEEPEMSTFKKQLNDALGLEEAKKVSEKNIDKLTNKDIMAALKQSTIQTDYEEFRQGLIQIVKKVDADKLGEFMALDKKASNAIEKLTEFVSKL